MKKILITGVTGFLGSSLAKKLVSQNYKVLGIKRKTSSLNKIKEILASLDLYDIETIDFESFFNLNNDIEIIIHTSTCYGRNNETFNEIYEANTELPSKLLNMASQANLKLFLNTDTILDKHLSLYAFTKNQFLEAGKLISKSTNIKFFNLKLEHFYGKNDDLSQFSTYIIHNCRSNTENLELTKGKQHRDFIYIDDVVDAFIILLEKYRGINENFKEFEIGSGNSIEIKEFVKIVHELSNSKTNLIFGALPYRKNEIMNYEANIEPLKALGWLPKTKLKEGIKKILKK